MSRPKNWSIDQSDNQFRQFRKKAKLTQEKLAVALNVAVTSIRRWEHNECEPTLTVRQLKSFCEAVDIKIQSLPDSLTLRN
jgi:DNA-binding XRE family transcriptional regulator